MEVRVSLRAARPPNCATYTEYAEYAEYAQWPHQGNRGAPSLLSHFIHRCVLSLFSLSSSCVPFCSYLINPWYKLVRFVGHGVLNRAKEGAKRAQKAAALAAGFLNPPEIDDLDPEGSFMMELTGERKTVKEPSLCCLLFVCTYLAIWCSSLHVYSQHFIFSVDIVQ